MKQPPISTETWSTMVLLSTKLPGLLLLKRTPICSYSWPWAKVRLLLRCGAQFYFKNSSWLNDMWQKIRQHFDLNSSGAYSSDWSYITSNPMTGKRFFTNVSWTGLRTVCNLQEHLTSFRARDCWWRSSWGYYILFYGWNWSTPA